MIYDGGYSTTITHRTRQSLGFPAHGYLSYLSAIAQYGQPPSNASTFSGFTKRKLIIITKINVNPNPSDFKLNFFILDEIMLMFMFIYTVILKNKNSIA